MDAETKLMRGKTQLLQSRIFYGALIMGVEFVEDTTGKIATMATNGRQLFWNRAFVDGLPERQLVGTLAHEACHPALLHHTRRGGRDPELWNDATDYCINPPLIADGLELPPGALIDARFEGMNANAVYRVLYEERRQKQEQEQPQQPQSGNDEQPGGGGDDDGDESDDEQAGDDEAPGDTGGDEESEEDGEAGGDEAGEGEGAGGDEPADLGIGGVLDAPSESGSGPALGSELTQEEADWQVRVEQAAAVARAAGQLPGGLGELIKANKKAEVDYRELLRSFMLQHSKADYSWRRPSRRHLARGMYLPGVHSEQMGEIVIILDTSGSTLPYRKSFAANATAAIEDTMPEKVRVINCDADVHSVDEYTGDDLPIVFTMIGGGGTRMGAAFEYIEREQIEPACVIVLTDLELYETFGREPSYPVLWCATKPGRAPWGEVVEING